MEVSNLILNELNDNYLPLFVNLSYSTTTDAIQMRIESKLEKRKGRMMGPSIGKKLIVFIDNINTPLMGLYGAQPPIELIRQYLDHNGWYDNKEKTFKEIVDVQLVAATGPSLNHIDSR